jgi:hypothetical protein
MLTNFSGTVGGQLRQVLLYIYTGLFIIFSVITNMYNKKTKGPTLMKKFFFQLEMFDVCTTGDTAHIDTIFKLLPHARQHVCIDILHCCNDSCLKARIIDRLLVYLLACLIIRFVSQ